jgi:tetratricopeptide (TPR) repeat protein
MSEGSVQDNLSLESLVAEVADEFVQRQRRGEQPDIEEYAALHPQAAELLRKVLASLDIMGLSGACQAAAGGDDHAGTLGDFRILAEVGRGGMGIVYEAEQLSLGRRVALKVLPLAAAMDPRQLERFRIEARAAAALRHEHIVAVHAVGCERGVHFIAMDFIDGITLAQLIQAANSPAAIPVGSAEASSGGEPTPPVAWLTTETGKRGRDFYRSAARLIAQAAEALEYAHVMGVVHRDIKPGNLMVDAAGALWVADFGMARFGPDDGLTVSGDLIGTLRYMSPEQALARHGLVDHRTDVYALGATLYELLTGHAAVGGADRQEIMRRLAFEESVPPRKLDRQIPADLETVVLKALAKEPTERYATAKELADDLNRFLEEAPIRAKRATVRQRVSRCVRRRPKTAAGLALVVVIALGAAAVWDRQRVQAEVAARQVANQAEDLFRRRRLPEAEAVARRAADLLPRFGGNAGLRRQIENMLADFTLLRRLEDARLERLNNQLDATDIDSGPSRAAFAAAFREEYGVDVLGGDEAVVLAELERRAVRAELIAALDDWSVETKDPAESLRLLKLADALDPEPQGVAAQWRRFQIPGNVDELRKLAAEAEKNPLPSASLVRLALGVIESSDRETDRETGIRLLRLAQRRQPDHLWVNVVLADQLLRSGPGHAAEALRYFTTALALRPNSPVALGSVGEALNNLGRHEEALEYLRMADVLAPNGSGIHINIGLALAKMGRYAEATPEFRTAAALYPDEPIAWHNLGTSLYELQRYVDAVEALRKAAILWKNVGTHNTLRARLQRSFFHRERVIPEVGTYNTLSACLAEIGQLTDAEAAAREAVKLAPNNAQAHFRLGLALSRQDRPAKAATSFRKSIELQPEATTWYNLSRDLRVQNKYAEAEAAVRAAIRLKPDYASAHAELGFILVLMGKLEGAVAAYQQAVGLDGGDARIRTELGNALADTGEGNAAIIAYQEAIKLKPDYAPAYYNLGITLAAVDPEKAISAYRRAVQLQPDHPEAHCNLGRVLQRQGQFTEALKFLRRGHELGYELKSKNPRRWPYPSALWVKECEVLDELERRLPAMLSGDQKPTNPAEAVAFAEVCAAKRLYGAAARFYADAFGEQPKLADDLQRELRYNAACAAALASCAQGEDAKSLDNKERARLRAQARDWLRAELAAWRRLLEKEPVKARPALVAQMQHWLNDRDFAEVRGSEALERLPAAERSDWQKLWQEVEGLRQRAAKPAGPESSGRP